MSGRTAPILAAFCGNELAGDDAFGPRVARALREVSPRGIELVDLGMKPAGLVAFLEGRKGLVVVDAAAPASDLDPGTFIDTDFFDPARPALLHDRTLSSHGLSIVHELQLARELGLLPERVWLIAAVAEQTTPGDGMSDAVTPLVGLAAEAVVRRATLWLDELAELADARKDGGASHA